MKNVVVECYGTGFGNMLSSTDWLVFCGCEDITRGLHIKVCGCYLVNCSCSPTSTD